MPTTPPKKTIQRVTRVMRKRYRPASSIDQLKKQVPKLPPHEKLPKRNKLIKVR